MPLALTGSTNALRGGNLITVEGTLEPFQRYIDPKRNRAVEDFFTTFRHKRQAEYATLSPNERRKQERQDQRFLLERQHEQSVRVRAGFVELHDGQPMTVVEAEHARQEFVKSQRQRRQREQRNGQSETGQRPSAAPAALPTAHQDDAVPDAQEQGARPVRHRRLAPREQDMAAALAPSNGQHQD